MNARRGRMDDSVSRARGGITEDGDAPASASTTMLFRAARSSAHIVRRLASNQAMFAAHCAAPRSVLHVPQMITLRAEMFRWLCFDQMANISMTPHAVQSP